MPAARRLLDENDLSPDAVRPTGPGGRILKEDVQRAIAEREGVPGADGREGAAETTAREAGSEPPARGVAADATDGRREEAVRRPVGSDRAALVEANGTAPPLSTRSKCRT